MKLLGSIFFKFFLLFLVLLVLLVAVDNSQEVTLRFVDYETVGLPLLWWMVFAFLLGVGCTLLVNSFTTTKLKLQARSDRNKAEKASQSLDKLRAEQTSA